MNKRTTSIAEDAEKLPATERIKLVEHLLETLDRPDPEIDKAWADAAETRLDAYLGGETTARDAKDVLAKHFKP